MKYRLIILFLILVSPSWASEKQSTFPLPMSDECLLISDYSAPLLPDVKEYSSLTPIVRHLPRQRRKAAIVNPSPQVYLSTDFQLFEYTNIQISIRQAEKAFAGLNLPPPNIVFPFAAFW